MTTDVIFYANFGDKIAQICYLELLFRELGYILLAT